MRLLLWFFAPLLLHADAAHPVFATYLGGGGNEVVGSVATDTQGNIYIAGRTDSSNFPVKNAIQPESRAFSQLFIAKFSPSGELLYSTYFGGSDNDAATAIAVDSAGNVYVTGCLHSQDFPTTNAFQSINAGGVDAFALKLDANGKVVYSTYLGGKFNDFGMGIAVDGAGNAYITGRTESPEFPVTPGALHTEPLGYTPGYTFVDVFVTKLDPAGQPVYSTFFGSGDGDVGWSIAVDAQGQAHVAGETWSIAFPVTPDAMQKTAGKSSRLGQGFTDGFYAKFSADGSQLLYSTYIGGPAQDSARFVTVDADGNAYVTGDTTDARLPIVNGPQQYIAGGVYRVSEDGGVTFTPRQTGLRASQVNSIAFDSNASSVVYAGTLQGVFRSNDGGNTWTPAGLDNLSVLKILVDPVHSGTIYAGTDFGGGLFRSTDSGDTWTTLGAGAPGDPRGSMFKTIAVDPSGSGDLYVFAGSGAIGSGFDQPLYRVSQNGAPWTPLGKGLPSTPIAIVVGPDSTAYAGTVRFTFFSFFGTGATTGGYVLKRSGDSWANAGLEDEVDTMIYQGGVFYAAGTSFYRSSDGGQTWTATPLPGNARAFQISVDARNPASIWILAGDLVKTQLLRSADGGQSFDIAGTGIWPAMAVSPFDSSVHLGALAAADAYVLKFAPDGTLLYSTFVGTPAPERGDSVALDPDGNLYVASFRSANTYLGYGDGSTVVTRIGADMQTANLGGSTNSTVLSMQSRAMTIAPDGAIIAVMIATQPGLTVQNAVQTDLNGASDVYLVKWYP